MRDLRSRWLAAVRLVTCNRDVLDGRPHEDGVAPPVLSARGWTSFLLGLGDEQLAALEIGGLEAAWPQDTPPSLVAFLEEAGATCALPSLACASDGLLAAETSPMRRHERPRKRAQIDAFARLILPLARQATRVLDVGSGHGHLTREIAVRVAVPVVGLERNEKLAARARTIASRGEGAPSYAVTDVLRDGLSFTDGDCVIGLHACGELGDAVVEGLAASRGRATLAIIGCCLQKQRGPARYPLCPPYDVGQGPMAADALILPKTLLGLSNLTPRNDGVEATCAENLAARERRLALHRLLSRASPAAPLRFGAEIEGLNRRAAHLDFRVLVARAFAHRACPAPSAAAIDEAATWARAHHARLRRLQLPRTMLARVVEVFVLLDRARFLEEHGFSIELGLAFPDKVSARNLALVAVRA